MNLKHQLIPVVGFCLMLVTAFVYNRIEDEVSLIEFAVLAIFSLLVYVVFITVYSWFYLKPHEMFSNKKEEYDEFLTKIEASVNKLIQKQRFIDQTTLDLIEKQAEDIWVITTKLESELTNENLQKSVKENLENNKSYTYFLPHPDNPHFDGIDGNIRRFKRLELYEQHKSQIKFIRLPIETIFLLEEVVIYNPSEGENKDDNTRGLNAFTFYDSKDEDTDSLHMKIEGNMLTHMRRRLDLYLNAIGLQHAVERILIEYSDLLENDEKAYLADFMNKREISNLKEYSKFLKTLKKKGVEEHKVSEIEKILNPYKSL